MTSGEQSGVSPEAWRGDSRSEDAVDILRVCAAGTPGRCRNTGVQCVCTLCPYIGSGCRRCEGELRLEAVDWWAGAGAREEGPLPFREAKGPLLSRS